MATLSTANCMSIGRTVSELQIFKVYVVEAIFALGVWLGTQTDFEKNGKRTAQGQSNSLYRPCFGLSPSQQTLGTEMRYRMRQNYFRVDIFALGVWLGTQTDFEARQGRISILDGF